MAPARGWWCAGPASESAVSLPAVPHLVTAQSGPLLELEQQGWVASSCILPRYWSDAVVHERIQACAAHGLSVLLQEAGR